MKTAKEIQLSAAKEIADRLRVAKKSFELRTGEDVSWGDLGNRVWLRLELVGPVDTSKVSRIKLGQQLATIPECGAFAEELGVSKGWLAFNEGRMELSTGGFAGPGDEGPGVTFVPAPMYPKKPTTKKAVTKPNRRKGA